MATPANGSLNVSLLLERMETEAVFAFIDKYPAAERLDAEADEADDAEEAERRAAKERAGIGVRSKIPSGIATNPGPHNLKNLKIFRCPVKTSLVRVWARAGKPGEAPWPPGGVNRASG
jgi:hypothetical protein